MFTKHSRFLLAAALISLSILAGTAVAQVAGTGSKRVKEIDAKGLARLIKPAGKPLLINFWATWCEPCREEFPDFVKIDAAYKGKIDIVMVSLDEFEDIGTAVPKFLADMKAEMPAYLLHTDDDNALQVVAKDWAGNLPLTVFYDANGTVAYQRNGKVRFDALKENIDRVLGSAVSGNGIFETVDFVKIKDGKRDEARYYYENNWRYYRAAAVKQGVIDSYEYIDVVDHDAAFDIILITRYRGEEQFNRSEAGFEPIIKELTPSGPFLRGNSKPDEFRKLVFSYKGKAVFSGSR